jgi:ring-1,2-phenylacetyl-CoA epoxidase subunit PaaE
MSTFYKLAVKDVNRETPEAISVAFHVPAELQDAYAFAAGQYITLKLTLDGQEIRRAYSICSSPNSKELRIAIKSIAIGSFSTFANKSLRVGDVVEVGTPEGNFTFIPNSKKAKNYMAFAAGSGITPIMSILKSVLESEPQSSFVLVYGNKSAEQTIFFDELHQLELQYTGRLFIHHFFSQLNTMGHSFGRIGKSAVATILKEKHKELEFDTFYLCGPEEMIIEVADALKSHQISESNIKFELFYSAKKQAPVSSENAPTQITVTVDDDVATFSMSKKQNILEAVLKQGIDAPYSCQGGICSSCMARVKKGTTVMAKNTILTDSEVADGLILTCQAYPTSAEIVVDYDDV